MGINIISTKNMPYREWLQYRRQGIGGSDAGAICGMSPYASPITVWADKKGKLPEKPDNEAMRQGRDFEEIVARRFCELTGKRVRRHNFLIRHDTYPFMQANVDRLVIGEKAGLECKTVWNGRFYRCLRSRSAGKRGRTDTGSHRKLHRDRSCG